MGRSNQGGGYDGADPDAEIERLRREDAAEQKRRADEDERRRIQDAQKRQGGKGGK